MTKEITAYEDDYGDIYRTKEEAETSNAQHQRDEKRNAAIAVLKDAFFSGQTLYGNDIDTLSNAVRYLETVNAETLMPLMQYLSVLIFESNQRTEKHG